MRGNSEILRCALAKPGILSKQACVKNQRRNGLDIDPGYVRMPRIDQIVEGVWRKRTFHPADACRGCTQPNVPKRPRDSFIIGLVINRIYPHIVLDINFQHHEL